MRKRLFAAVVVALAMTASPAVASPPPEPMALSPAERLVPAATSITYINIQGADRVGTAVAASQHAFPGTADTIVLCTGWNWPDALGGGALAGACGGPLLLTRPDRLSSAVVTEAIRLDARRVIIIGSDKAVSAEVESELRALDVNGHGLVVERIGGAGRFDTAALTASATVAAIKGRGGTYDGTAFFATGYGFPDALAASPISANKGWPILLVHPSGLTTPTEDAVGGLGIIRGIMLGSDKVVTPAVADRLTSLLPSKPERWWGADRYATAVQIARKGVANGLKWDGVAIARGDTFPDALAGGVMQARFGSVMLLTRGDVLKAVTRDELTLRMSDIATVRFLGGPSALRPGVRDAVSAALCHMLFPVAGKYSYTDTWGAPRSGGRTHQGTDIMAAQGTPCVAVLDGVVSSKEGGLGGKVIYLDADNGWSFYYAHLSGWAVTSGRVKAGQVIGYVGATGNAAGGPPHLHIQMWTPSGSIVNPYPYLKGMER